MSESDSNDGTPLKCVCSVSSPSEWDMVPKETDFKFKFKTPGKKGERLLYILKKDICLFQNRMNIRIKQIGLCMFTTIRVQNLKIFLC